MGNCQENFYLDSWLGDGVCDDGSWGVYFNCDEFNCDEGDCECGTEGDQGGLDPNPYCGDGNCDQLEDSLNCPEDCTEEVIGSCENNCGGNAGSCWCDDQCMSLGDCCPDFNEFCSDSSLVNNGKIHIKVDTGKSGDTHCIYNYLYTHKNIVNQHSI